MKFFLKKLCMFMLLLFVADFAVGKVFDVFRIHAKGGSTYQNEYIANKCITDILILGSSRASHHYDPSVISGGLGFSCYNAGKDGCGMILDYARFAMIAERRYPKVVICDIAPNFDYIVEKGKDYTKYIGQLKPYYEKEVVREVMDGASTAENNIFLRLSHVYRYNSRIMPLIVDSLVSRGNTKPDGYLPLFGVMETESSSKNNGKKDDYQIDSVKFFFFEKLVQECKKNGVTLIFAVSPIYRGELSESYRPAMELAQKYNIPFWNCINVEGISDDNKLFQDMTHMNKDGAKVYSEMIAMKLKNIVGNQM